MRPGFGLALMLSMTLAGALPGVVESQPRKLTTDESPVATSQEMRNWVRRQGLPAASSPQVPTLERLRRLWQAMTAAEEVGGLGLREEIGVTRNAAETFRARVGDCVSFAHLFVALAREAGVEVGFVAFVSPEAMEEVGRGERELGDQDDQDDQDEGGVSSPGLRLAIGHLAAGWVSGGGELWIFDFAGMSLPAQGKARRVSDATAAAIYHSNLGVAALLEQRDGVAVRHLERAVGLAPGMPVLWINLGVARRRSGDTRGAVAAYRRALALEPGSATARSNLRAAR